MSSKKSKSENKVANYFKTLPKRYFITAFSGMAQGLFVTLIAGTILEQIAGWFGDNYFADTLKYIAYLAKFLMGAGIGVGIAHALGKNKLLTFSAVVAGMVGAMAEYLLPSGMAGVLSSTAVGTGLNGVSGLVAKGLPGNPIGAYVTVMLCVEVVGLYAGKTKLDILLVPLGTLVLAFGGVFLSVPFIWLVGKLGIFVAWATGIAPLFMGIIIAVVMGILLTMPTSSAAIWVSVASGVILGYAKGEVDIDAYNSMLIAGGASTVGCACHMVGFAVASFRENKVSGLISQGIGTSMLQIPNVMKKPIIMLPMVLSSAILGPLSTCVFKVKCGYSGGGMGTSGLVGVFDCFKYTEGALGIVGIILLMIVLPAVLNLLFSELMRKWGWIKKGDYQLDL